MCTGTKDSAVYTPKRICVVSENRAHKRRIDSWIIPRRHHHISREKVEQLEKIPHSSVAWRCTSHFIVVVRAHGITFHKEDWTIPSIVFGQHILILMTLKLILWINTCNEITNCFFAIANVKLTWITENKNDQNQLHLNVSALYSENTHITSTFKDTQKYWILMFIIAVTVWHTWVPVNTRKNNRKIHTLV